MFRVNVIPSDDLNASIPIDIIATGSFHSITLEWTTSSGVVRKYEIERADDSSFTVNIKRWFVDATRYTDVTNVTGQLYYYRIRAIDTAGRQSDWSVIVSASTLPLTGVDGNNVDHLHGVTRLIANGTLATFPLVDIAEYIESITVQGFEVDQLLYTLSAQRDSVIFNTTPTVGNMIMMHYVTARL